LGELISQSLNLLIMTLKAGNGRFPKPAILENEKIMDEKSIGLETTSFAAPRLGRYAPLWLLLFGLLALFTLIVSQTLQETTAVSLPDQLITAQTLAEQYGMQVNLIAVTAAGGLVDLRLKVLDAEKVGLLLQDSTDVPALLTGEDGTILKAPEDNEAQLLNTLKDGDNVFLMFPNVGHAIKPGMPVTVVFGDVALEPIAAH